MYVKHAIYKINIYVYERYKDIKNKLKVGGLAVHICIGLFDFIGSHANATSDKFFENAHLRILQMVQIVVARRFCHFRHDVVQNFQFASRKYAVE